MSALEQFVLDYETTEQAEDMHFSLYSIPQHYHNEEEPPQWQ